MRLLSRPSRRRGSTVAGASSDVQPVANPGDALLAPRVTVALDRPTPWRMLADAWRWRAVLPRVGIRVTIKGFSGTKLGRAWLVLRPAIGIFGLALLFGRVLDAPSDGLPYLVFVLFGVHAWMAFERPAFWAVRSFDVYRRLARNLFMPLVLIPLAAVLPALIELSVIGVFAAAVLVYFSIADGTSYLQLGPAMLLAPVGYLLGMLLALSLGLWLSVLNAYARDVRIVFIYVLRVWMFVTPVVYPITQLTGGLRTIAEYNPVSGPVTIVKWALLGVGEFPWDQLRWTFLWLLVVGASGAWFFARQSPTLLAHQPAGTFDDEEDV